MSDEDNVLESASEETTGEQQQEQTPKIPEKFQGKSAEELVDMYTNLESAYSKQGNELGEYRSYVHDLLKSQVAADTTPKSEPQPEPDWEYEPDKAAGQLVEKEVGKVDNRVDQLEKRLALKDFESKYPNYQKDSSSPEFLEWAQSSPYRNNLLQKNLNGIDFDAASELLDSWAERQELLNQSKDGEKADRQEQLKKASMEKSSSAGGSRKRMWTSREIIDMRKFHPDEYNKHKDEISRAYDEGRVRRK